MRGIWNKIGVAAICCALVAGTPADAMEDTATAEAERLVAEYGLGIVIETILRQRDGRITVQAPGERPTLFVGKPSKDIVNARTVALDIAATGLSANEFETKLIAKKAERDQMKTRQREAARRYDEAKPKELLVVHERPLAATASAPDPLQEVQTIEDRCVAMIRATGDFKDPESLRVEAATVGSAAAIDYKGQTIVGYRYYLTINAKNSYGAYAGAKTWVCELSQHDKKVLNVKGYGYHP